MLSFKFFFLFAYIIAATAQFTLPINTDNITETVEDIKEAQDLNAVFGPVLEVVEPAVTDAQSILEELEG